jgi:acetolactate synthase-1/2/3 large subunit
MRFFQTKQAGGYIHNGTGSMGYAIPSAIAAKLLHPDKQVVAVCGDGGFAMTMNGLFTARDENLGVVVVVLNNHTFAHSLHGTGVEIGTGLGEFDYAAIARGMGCEGVRVTDPADLAKVLSDAVDRSIPTVIDVIISPDMKFSEVSVGLASFKGSTDLSGYTA